MKHILKSIRSTHINKKGQIIVTDPSISSQCAIIISFTIVKENRFSKLFLEIISFSLICISPLVLGTAIFLALFQYIDISNNALVLTGLVNGILTIPFTLTILLPGFTQITNRYGQIMRSLGLSNIKQIYEIAKIKQKDEHLSHFPLQSLCRMIMGSCQSIGLKVEGLKEPRPRVDYM